MSDFKEALSIIKAVYDDGVAEINGRSYCFMQMRHEKRRSVFAFYTGVANAIQLGDFSFLDTPNFSFIEKIINDSITLDGSVLSKLSEHWDKHPEDYIKFITTALAVISYPFLRGSSLGLQSQTETSQNQKSLKPMSQGK